MGFSWKILFLYVAIYASLQLLAFGSRTEPYKRCIKGQVYVSNSFPINDDDYVIDNTTFCCPNDKQHAVYSDPSQDVKFLDCCTGSEQNAIYDVRNGTCIGARVLSVSDIARVGHSTLRNPFQFFYFFHQDSCSKTRRKKSIATGTLLTPARVEMSNGRNVMVSEFSISGPFSCHRKGTWFVIPSSKFLDYVTDSLKITNAKEDMIHIKSSLFRTALNSYLAALEATV